MSVNIRPSTRKDKKYMAIFDDKVVHFGQKGASDYTLNKNDVLKNAYIKRHEKNENWNDPYTAGALSRWILWNKKSLQESINDYKRRFNFK